MHWPAQSVVLVCWMILDPGFCWSKWSTVSIFVKVKEWHFKIASGFKLHFSNCNTADSWFFSESCDRNKMLCLFWPHSFWLQMMVGPAFPEALSCWYWCPVGQIHQPVLCSLITTAEATAINALWYWSVYLCAQCMCGCHFIAQEMISNNKLSLLQWRWHDLWFVVFFLFCQWFSHFFVWLRTITVRLKNHTNWISVERTIIRPPNVHFWKTLLITHHIQYDPVLWYKLQGSSQSVWEKLW